MKYNEEKVDEIALALLHMTTFRDGHGLRAWKGHDWDVLNRLHQKGYISDPKSKARSVMLSEDGAKLSEELFWQHFGLQ
jgi:hypothetical protein